MADEADRANDQADEDIPVKRQKLGAVSRCFDCQNAFEKGRR